MLVGMNEDAFWQFIKDSRPTEPDPDAELLAATLTERLAQSPLSLVIALPNNCHVAFAPVPL